MTDGGDEAQDLGVDRIGIDIEDVVGLKCEHALIVDLAQTCNKALPIANGMTLFRHTGVGSKMLVGKSVVIVNVEDRETFSKLTNVFLDVASGEDRVSNVKADAKVISA